MGSEKTTKSQLTKVIQKMYANTGMRANPMESYRTRNEIRDRHGDAPSSLVFKIIIGRLIRR